MAIKARNRPSSSSASVQEFHYSEEKEKPKYAPRLSIKWCPETRAKVFASLLTLLAIVFLRFACHSPKDGPPRNLVVVGKRTFYQHVPLEYKRRFYIDDDNAFRRTVIRAFRNRGWRKANEQEEAQFVWDKYAWTQRFEQLLPWQRYSHFPGMRVT